MRKKKLFMLSILIVSLAVALSVYFSLGVSNIVEWLALFTSYLAVVYAILAERNPMETEKQQIYGQLKGITIDIITILEKKNYERFAFGLWDNIRKDQRYEMFDEKLAKRLDAFLESTCKYSDIICKLDYTIIPNIIRETMIEVFREEPNIETPSPVSLNVADKRVKPTKYGSVNVVNYLKEQVKLSDAISRTLLTKIEKTEMSGIETEVKFRKVDSNEPPFTSKDFKKIAKFWDMCLQKVSDLHEHQFVVKENDNLLREAKEIKEELVKRIKKSMEK